MAGRQLVRRGECLFAIKTGEGRLRLIPVGSWDVTGDADPATWRYRCDTFGPSGNQTGVLPAESVIHARYGVDPAGPMARTGTASLGALHGDPGG